MHLTKSWTAVRHVQSLYYLLMHILVHEHCLNVMEMVGIMCTLLCFRANVLAIFSRLNNGRHSQIHQTKIEQCCETVEKRREKRLDCWCVAINQKFCVDKFCELSCTFPTRFQNFYYTVVCGAWLRVVLVTLSWWNVLLVELFFCCILSDKQIRCCHWHLTNDDQFHAQW